MFETNRTTTILYCSNWESCVQFYKQVLNLNVNFKNEWFVEFQLNDTTFLAIADSSRATIKDVAGEGITLSWQTPDLIAAQKELKTTGVKTSEIQKKWNAHVFYFHDPEGHRIELWQPVKSDLVTNAELVTNADLFTSVPDWLIDHPNLLPLFKDLRIDYCCGGKSLETACREQDLDPQKVLDQIRERIL